MTNNSSACCPSASGPARSPIITKNSPLDWLVGLLVCAAVFFFMWAYHQWWRAKPYSVISANECLALAGLWGMSIALALGPLHRLCGVGYVIYRLRRPIALWAVVAAGLHLFFTLILLNPLLYPAYKGKFDWQYYVEGPWHLITGIIASLLLILLASMSTLGMLRRLGAMMWKNLQQLGYLALVITVIHYLVLGSYGKWVKWFSGAEPNKPAPPGTFAVTIFVALVLILKVIDVFASRRRPAEGA